MAAWDTTVYWALDLETGGLDPRTDALLAVGMVPVRGGVVQLGEAYQSLVRPEEEARAVRHASVPAHGLLGQELAPAPALAEVLAQVLSRVREGALLVHHRRLDVAFLQHACKRSGLRWPRPPVVDTVELLLRAAKRRRRAHPELPDTRPPLQLSAARRAWGLPEYPAHDALTDALATAELFLVLRHALDARTLEALT